jgi:hypothetical protein
MDLPGATFAEFIATSIRGDVIDMRDPERVKNHLRKSAGWSRRLSPQMNATGDSAHKSSVSQQPHGNTGGLHAGRVVLRSHQNREGAEVGFARETRRSAYRAGSGPGAKPP